MEEIRSEYDGYKFIIEVIIEKNEMFSCHIPAYRLYYSSKTFDDIKKIGKAMVGSHFKFYEECYQAWAEVNKNKIAALNSPEAKQKRFETLSKEQQEEVLTWRKKLKEYKNGN